jgi:peptidoglycan/LPS O-acetylase OafA/YrhL
MKQEKIKYINHIQTLRAFSVLLVFFFHCNLVFFNNGYLGVDIFFIISGYVITKLLEQNFFKNKSYQFKNFYFKRIIRIFPVYFFVITIFCLFFLFIGPLTDLDYIIKKIAYLITFTTNFYYLNYSNKEYFDNIFQDPLNHTWSLAVEMQFYLFFPFLIFFLKKNFNRKYIIIILSKIIIFGIFFTFFFFENINLSFYSPIFRFWEFLLGSLAYYVHTKKNNLNIENYTYLFYFILFFIIIFSNANFRFFNLLLITTITFLFLVLKKNQSHLNSIFNNNIIVHLGNISYSFYLWHLPILYFFNIYFENKVKFVFAFLITYLLSYFSFFFIEQKFKNFKINIINKIFFFGIACILLISGTIKIYYYEIKNFITSNNYLEKKFSLTKRINYTEIKINNNEIYKFCTEESKNYNLNHYSLRKECLKITDKETLIYVEGDSHTAMFLPLIFAYDNFKNIYYIHNNSNYFHKEVNNQLKNFKNLLYVRSINSLDELNYFKKNLQNFDKRINFLIITPIPNYYNDKVRPVECLIQNRECFFETAQDYKTRELNLFYKNINQLKNSQKNIIFFDPYEFLCPKKKCYIHNTKNKLLIYRDGNHLTIEGSLSLKKNFDLFLNNYFK